MRTPLVFALPKGRIQKEALPLLKRAGIEPEPAFFDPASRQLTFKTNHPDLTLVVVRSFDVATFVSFGVADFGIVGRDVFEEVSFPNLYSPVDLKIGACRLSVATTQDLGTTPYPPSGALRVATKYPNLTQAFFAERNVLAECVKLNGAMELAPLLGLCSHIVDLVSTGTTLKANGLVEREVILPVTSYLILNRASVKTKTAALTPYWQAIEEAVACAD